MRVKNRRRAHIFAQGATAARADCRSGSDDGHLRCVPRQRKGRESGKIRRGGEKASAGDQRRQPVVLRDGRFPVVLRVKRACLSICSPPRAGRGTPRVSGDFIPRLEDARHREFVRVRGCACAAKAVVLPARWGSEVDRQSLFGVWCLAAMDGEHSVKVRGVMIKQRARVRVEAPFKRAPDDACFKHDNRQAPKSKTRLKRVVIKWDCDGEEDLNIWEPGTSLLVRRKWGHHPRARPWKFRVWKGGSLLRSDDMAELIGPFG